jgi:hypothetical protein
MKILSRGSTDSSGIRRVVARSVLSADLLESSCQDRLFDLSRHHDDPVDITEDEVAGLHANAGADDQRFTRV